MTWNDEFIQHKHTIEETKAGTYAEPFFMWQYGVFTTTADGSIRFIASDFSADSALSGATLYYHDMNKYEHNNMDMSEIERFSVRRRKVTYDTWSEEYFTARECVKENNPWFESGEHWKE